MKKTFTHEHTRNDIPGHVIVDITDVAPADFSNQKNAAGKPLAKAVTLGSWRQRYKTQVPLTTPFSPHQILVDLSPWSHLDDNTFMRVDIRFVPSIPIGPTDPRFPKGGHNIIAGKPYTKDGA
jgi:hypothetical protein